jgi:beta-glucosidase
MDLVKSIYATAAREGRAFGMHHLDTLVIEPDRDPRMGRNMEGYSEDAYLVSRITEAIVHGTQGDNVVADDKMVALLTDFPGQSQPEGGLERGALQISERTLREVFLPMWVVGIKKAGALGVMAGYPEIDDIPTHESESFSLGFCVTSWGSREWWWKKAVVLALWSTRRLCRPRRKLARSL